MTQHPDLDSIVSSSDWQHIKETILDPWYQVCVVAAHAWIKCGEILALPGASKIERLINVSQTGATRRVDLLVDQWIVERLTDLRFKVISEESGNCGYEEGKYFAVIDPVDGSSVAVRGMDSYAVSIACGLCREGAMFFEDISFGVVLSRYGIFYSQKGAGAFVGKQRLRVSNIMSIKDAVIRQSRYSTKLLSASGTLLLGSSAVEICLLAAGILDAYIEPKQRKVFDYAAAALIAEEAGGVVGDLSGAPLLAGVIELGTSSDLLFTSTHELSIEVRDAILDV